MTRVYYSELLAKNALKAEEIKISVLISLCYYRELHIQISERFRALLDLKVGVRIGVTFPTVTLDQIAKIGIPAREKERNEENPVFEFTIELYSDFNSIAVVFHTINFIARPAILVSIDIIVKNSKTPTRRPSLKKMHFSLVT